MNKVRLVLLSIMMPILGISEFSPIHELKHMVAEKYGDNNLIRAICNNDILQVKTLLDEGANVNAEEEKQMPPVVVAVIYGNIEIVDLLVDRGADIGCLNQTPLYIVSAAGYKNVAEWLKPIVRNNRINQFKHSVLGNDHNALIRAICNDDIKQVQILLDEGADINEVGNDNLTPLAVAVGCENKEMTELLLHRGADIHYGLVLLNAVKTYRMEMGALLLERGANANEADDYNVTPLMYVVASRYYADVKMVELLLTKGADINARCDSRVDEIDDEDEDLHYFAHHLFGKKADKSGRSVLMHAHDMDIIKLLLANGADVNAIDKDNSTLLITATRNGIENRVIRLLVDNGANVNVQDVWNYSPLMYAVARNDVETVQLLLERGADLTVKSGATFACDDHGYCINSAKEADPKKTALDIAKENGNQAIIQLLEQVAEQNKTL